MLLEGLRGVLSPNFTIVGAVTNGRALLEAAQAQQPDLIIADISMPEIDGIEATRRLRRLVPSARVLVLSIHTDPSWVHAAFDAGARGYLTKTSAFVEIETAVREVLKGNFYISAAVTSAFLGKSRQETGGQGGTAHLSASETLTQREAEIVRLVGKGLGNREIAQELGLSVATVRSHLSKLYGKIGVVGRVELALYAAHCEET
jgi:DNA-binding NarL/FixJ family response regulator